MGQRASLLLFLFLLVQFRSSAQRHRNSPALYSLCPAVRLVTLDSAADKIGGYRMGRSLVGVFLTLDSTGHFRTGEYSCMGGLVSDSGRWLVSRTGRIGLRSASGTRTLEVVKFSHYYFCIAPNREISFARDFRKIRARYVALKPVHMEDRIYTADDVIAYELMPNYYGRNVDPFYR